MLILVIVILVLILGSRFTLLDDSLDKLLYVEESEGDVSDALSDSTTESTSTTNTSTIDDSLIKDSIVSDEEAINMLDSIYNGGRKSK